MACGKALEEGVRQVIITMSACNTAKSISTQTGINIQTVQRVLQVARLQPESDLSSSPPAETCGRKKKFSEDDLLVSTLLFSFS